MSVSLICACKNRYDALRVSLNSWLCFKEITEIIIVDWSSDQSLSHLVDLDEKINVIRVENQKYFNQPQPLNLAASIAKNKYILKVDSDYILNPYYNFFDKYTIDDKSFVSGKNSYKSPEIYSSDHRAYVVDFSKMQVDEVREYCNSYSPYFKYLTGLLYITKDNFMKVGGYNESLGKYYSYEDDEIYQRLELFGLNHKKIRCDYFLIHIPHQDQKRLENFEGYDINERILIKQNLSGNYDENEVEWQSDYVLASSHTENNKKIISKIENYYIKNSSNWNIQKINERHYLAVMNNKNTLKNFPKVYYISLEESEDRRINIHKQFYEYGYSTLNALLSKRFHECNDNVIGKQIHILDEGTIGCVLSHIKAIRDWYFNSSDDEEYAFFCEDDLSLETVKYWNFTWEEFIDYLPDDAECVQLCSVRSNQIDVKFRERSMYDWSVTAYIMNKNYAKKIITQYCRNDDFVLDISGTNFYPMPETVLFYGIGKVYCIDLFVEDQNLKSTFTETANIEGGNKDYHVESYEHVINWWKQNGKKMSISEIMGTHSKSKIFSQSKTELEKLLTVYSLDTENPEHNFNLGVWYENHNHTAPALSYFLRCAERSTDNNLAYEALIRGSYCYQKQGERDGSTKSLLQQALVLLPNRPEAYFLLSRFAERKQWWQDCYIYAEQGLIYSDFNSIPLKTDVEYPGKYGLLFEKALSGWWWGKFEESKEIFLDLQYNYNLSESYKKIVENNLKSCNVTEDDIKKIRLKNNIEEPQIIENLLISETKIDIILQGKYDEVTDEIINSYLDIPFLNNLIVSCWTKDKEEIKDFNDKVKFIRNEYPKTFGTENRNLQIVSSLEGIKRSSTDISVKMRSDQKYTYNSIVNMMDFYLKNRKDKKLFVAGMYPNLLFHPRDHIFWGKTEDLYNLFDIPLELYGFTDKVNISKKDLYKFYSYFIRTETYIGGHYCARFDERIKLLFENPNEYLHDNSPQWNYSKEISDSIIHKVFKSFPRENINLEWKKKELECYPYDEQKYGYGEHWHEDGY